MSNMFNMMLRVHNTARNNIFSVDFLVVRVYQNFLAFTCVNPLLFLLLFIIFIILLPFGMNFKFNFELSFNSISFFHVNCKISFGFFPIKEKSLGLLELASKM